MTHVAAVSACLATLVFGSLTAAATSPAPSLQLDISIALERTDQEAETGAINTMVEQSVIEERHTPELPSMELLEPSAPSEAWEQRGVAPGVAFSVNDDISLGLDYELEELEELTADRIEMGSASADHASHNVMLRANIQFDLVEP